MSSHAAIAQAEPSAPTFSSPRPLRSLREVLFALLFATAAHAQDLTIKAPPQSRPVLITGGTVHTVSGETIKDGFVLFDGGVIKAVGKGDAPSAKNPERIDAKGKHIYPGLIGADTNLGLTEIGTVRSADDTRETADVAPEVRAAVAVNPDSTLIPVARSNGILTVGVFPRGGRIAGRVSVMRLDGWTWEQMAVRADAGLTISWPQSRVFNFPGFEQSDTEQADAMRRGQSVVDDAFKTAAAYAAAHDADPTLPKDLRWEAMRAVFVPPIVGSATIGAGGGGREQLPVFISAQDMDQITGAVTWALDKKLRPVIVGGRDAPLCADLLKRHDVPVIVLGTLTTPRRADAPYDDAYTLPARLLAAGVRFCLDSGEEPAHERNLPNHAAMAVAYGLDPDAAIKAITLWPAQILGVGDKLGSLDTGKAATLIVTDGNILEVSSHVEKAWIDGRAIDLSNKQTKLAEKYREKYRQQKAK